MAAPRDIKVYIIESPSPRDILDGQHEGATLRAALTHSMIRSELHTVVSEEMLFVAAERIMHDMTTAPRDVFPIVHLSMHGNSTGIGLTDGERFPWTDLAALMEVLNSASGEAPLLVCMSTCHGFAGARMAHRNEDPPFFALVGPNANVDWPDTVAAFAAFYHHLKTARGGIRSGVELMNGIIGVERPLFQCTTGVEAKQAHERYQRFRQVVAGIQLRESGETREGLLGLAMGNAPPEPSSNTGGENE